MKNFWTRKKVIVTGGSGFIGSFVCEQLLKLDAKVTITTRSGNLEKVKHIKKDLNVNKSNLNDFYQAQKAIRNQDIVLNLASKVSGIKFNIKHPALMFSENVALCKNVFESAVINNIERLLVVSSACVYPRNCSIPTPEDEGFLDEPDLTNLGYGWAKRVSELFGRFYSKEYGMKIAIARPYNVYGPRDNFDIETSTVIPGLVKRIFDEENPLQVWGSGKQTRSFLNVEDCARGLIEITEKYPMADPVNIGSDEEISIANLAKLIIKQSGKNPQIKFDTSKQDGQPRRKCDTSKSKVKFGFEPKIALEDGLWETINWYKQKFC